MYVRLLQPKLVPSEIDSNAQEVIALCKAEKKRQERVLYLCGCETTIGQSRTACHYPETVVIEQQHALKKIQRHLGAAAMLIGGVSINSECQPHNLQHQIFFLTPTSITELLPTQQPILGAANEVVVDEVEYKFSAKVYDLGDYYYLNLHFAVPEEKEIHIYMHSHIQDFSPYSLERVAALFRANCKGDVYLSNRVGMSHGHLQGGYSAYLPRTRGNSQRRIHAPIPDNKEEAELLENFPKRTVAFQYEMTVRALRLFFENAGQKKAILGLSGGIDSALVLVIAVAALGAENVLGVIMPSQYTAEVSVTSAQELAKNLGVDTKVIPIQPLTEAYLNTLAPYFEGLPPDTTEENLQARVRAVLLMALSNKFGYILLNTSNKSECAVGYSTMYGDACGAVSVIGGLYKTEVYEMSRWLNREREIIPSFIIERPPSAELRPDQTDQDSLPPYEILDAILTEMLDKGKRPERVRLPNVGKENVLRVARLVKNAAYKRYQMPPCLRIAPDSFFDK